MKLHTREWGAGDRVAVLIHGMMGESRQYWQVGPALADLGYRAIAVDLPGHGHSPTSRTAGLSAYAAALVASVPEAPHLAIGHSLGGTVLAEALAMLSPRRAVYVDIPFQSSNEDAQDAQDAQDQKTALEAARDGRTLDGLRRTRPWWTDQDRRVEVEAARLYDIPTAVALMADLGRRSPKPPRTDVPSLLIRPEPSAYVCADRADELRALGFEVRSVPGAGHSVWYGFFDEFMSALDGWA